MPIKRCSADINFSLCVRERAENTCEHCQLTNARMECAHIYGRRNKAVRWEPMNAVCLCHSCHRNFTENPLDFDSWCERHLGEAHLEILNEKRRPQFKTNAKIRREIGAYYKKIHNAMLAQRSDGATGYLEFVGYS